jgi:transcriptional regulator with GAF, ATPase, and Fis domain
MNRDVERLLAINRELARDHDPERLLERIIDAAVALSGAERGFLLLASAEPGAELEVRTARGLDARHLAPGELQISRSIARQVIDSNAPLSAIDAQQDQRFRDYQSVHSLKLRSVMCLPLRAGSSTLGAIYLDHRYRASAFTETDVALLAAFGDQAAIAIANARLLAELTLKASELETSRAAIDELNQRLERELAAREAELAARKPHEVDEPAGKHGMIGRTPAMRDLFRVIDRVADKDVPVTISGESGTGKELVARALHAASSRRGPVVPLNCGAIPEALLESELFGHERGAFTGAVRAKPGLFEIARGGTIFLDEIGDMPLGMQVKLLRVLQTREFRRVGGTVDLASDARVVSATNRNLEELVRTGVFREDLWYRLNVVDMHRPPLRERRDDLPLLIDHLLASHARGLDVRLSKRALALLLDYAWPGNVRELDNELQRAIALADGVIEPDVLSSKVAGRTATESAEQPTDGTLKRSIDRHERDVIRGTLAEHGGRVAAAARALGLTRAGLYKKMHKLGLSAPDRD